MMKVVDLFCGCGGLSLGYDTPHHFLAALHGFGLGFFGDVDVGSSTLRDLH